MKARAAIVILLLLRESICFGQHGKSEIVQGGFSGSVAQTLTYIGRTFKTPFVAECDAASDKQVSVPPGPMDGQAALNGLLAQTGLASTFVSGTTYVYDQAIVRDPADQLSYVFPSFNVPRDADLFLGLLFARLHNDFGKLPGDPTIGGYAESTIRNDELRDKLKEEKIDYMSARNLLLQEAGTSHSFWAVVCYAKAIRPEPNIKTIPVAGVWSWGEATTKLK